MSYPDESSIALDAAEALTRFVVHAQLMLDPLTPENLRQDLEPQLLSVLPTLKALGVFELFTVRDPALRALVEDELAQRSARLVAEVASI